MLLLLVVVVVLGRKQQGNGSRVFAHLLRRRRRGRRRRAPCLARCGGRGWRPALRRQLSDVARKLLMGALTTPPHAFLCPITLEVMKEPVVCADGHTYERSAIEEWLRAGKRTSPVTGKRLPSVTTVTNFALRSSIEEFVAQRDAIETRNKSADDHDRARGGVLDQLRQRQQQVQGEKRWDLQV